MALCLHKRSCTVEHFVFPCVPYELGVGVIKQGWDYIRVHFSPYLYFFLALMFLSLDVSSWCILQGGSLCPFISPSSSDLGELLKEDVT